MPAVLKTQPVPLKPFAEAEGVPVSAAEVSGSTLKYFTADWRASQKTSHLEVLGLKLQFELPVDATLLCSIAILQHAPAEVWSRVHPPPAVSVSEFWSKYIAIIISLAFRVVALLTAGPAPPPVQ